MIRRIGILVFLAFFPALATFAQDWVTGSTTWTGPVLVENTDPVPLSELVGARRAGFAGITLDGAANRIEVIENSFCPYCQRK